MRPDSGHHISAAVGKNKRGFGHIAGLKLDPHRRHFRLAGSGQREARATWQWANFLEDQAGPHRPVIHLNMDETSIPMWMSSGAGYVRLPQGQGRKEYLEKECKAPLGKRRSNMSLICFLCNDTSVQSHLPQFLISNDKILAASTKARLDEELCLCTDFMVLRRKSAWVTSKFLVKIFGVLGEVLREAAAEKAVILTIDMCPTHATPAVVQAAARNNLLLHFVPGGMTGYLQPLDAYFFGPLKQKLRSGYHDLQTNESASGEVTTLQVCQLVVRVVRELLNSRCWAHAFAGCGYGHKQSLLGGRARRKLEWTAAEARCSAEMPTLKQLQACWITSWRIPIGWLFHCVQGLSEGAFPAIPPPEPVARHSVWAGRLRSSGSNLDLTVAASSSSSPAAPTATLPPRPPTWPRPPPPSSSPVPLTLVPRAVRLGPPLPQPRPRPRPPK